jgi:predicted transcriptional regulator
VLSTKNQALLEAIRRDEPQSLKELAGLSGRAESNLSRTLQTLAQYGFVRLNKAEGRRVVPEVLYDRVALDLPLDKAA